MIHGPRVDLEQKGASGCKVNQPASEVEQLPGGASVGGNLQATGSSLRRVRGIVGRTEVGDSGLSESSPRIR